MILDMLCIIYSNLRIYLLIILFNKKLKHHFNVKLSLLSKLNFMKGSKVSLGKNLVLNRFSEIFVGKNGELNIGNNVFFNNSIYLSCQENILIGDNCIFGPNVMLFDNNHRFNKCVPIYKSGLNSSPIIIRDNCWLGSNVVVLKGITIGENSVIASGVVVDRNVPANTIVRSYNDLIFEEIKRENNCSN